MTKPVDLSSVSLADMARDMQINLYARYTEKEAAGVLGISEQELSELHIEGRIAYLQLSSRSIGFFGSQLLTYLRQCAVPAGGEPPASTISKPAAKEKVSAKAEFLSVDEAKTYLGISRSKLYQLLSAGEITTIKIGRRTLIPQTSLNEFTERPSTFRID